MWYYVDSCFVCDLRWYVARGFASAVVVVASTDGTAVCCVYWVILRLRIDLPSLRMRSTTSIAFFCVIFHVKYEACNPDPFPKYLPPKVLDSFFRAVNWCQHKLDQFQFQQNGQLGGATGWVLSLHACQRLPLPALIAPPERYCPFQLVTMASFPVCWSAGEASFWLWCVSTRF